MRSNKFVLLLAAAIVAGAGVFASCSSSGKSGTVALNAGTGPAVAATSDGGVAPVDLGNGISLDRVRIVVRKLELELAGASGDAGGHRDGVDDDLMHGDAGASDDGGVADDEGDDEGEVVRGPFLIDLSGAPLAGGIHQAFDTQVPVGIYDRVCFEVNTVSKPMASQDPGIAGMQTLHASIAIDGAIDANTFEFTTPFAVAQCRKGSFTVGTGTTNLTFDVNYRGWFTGRDGGRLDPRVESDRGQILQNIRCSIRIFRDDDMDGHPDDGEDDSEDEGREGCPPVTGPPAPDGGTPDGGMHDGGLTDGGLTDGGLPL
jgi:hypothetical protein